MFTSKYQKKQSSDTPLLVSSRHLTTDIDTTNDSSESKTLTVRILF